MIADAEGSHRQHGRLDTAGPLPAPHWTGGRDQAIRVGSCLRVWVSASEEDAWIRRPSLVRSPDVDGKQLFIVAGVMRIADQGPRHHPTARWPRELREAVSLSQPRAPRFDGADRSSEDEDQSSVDVAFADRSRHCSPRRIAEFFTVAIVRPDFASRRGFSSVQADASKPPVRCRKGISCRVGTGDVFVRRS